MSERHVPGLLESDSQIVDEWRNYYVNFQRLRGWIYELDSSGSAEAAQQFFDELSVNIDRTEKFYTVKEDALVARTEGMPIEAGAKEEEIKRLTVDIPKLFSYATVNVDRLMEIANIFDTQVSSKRDSMGMEQNLQVKKGPSQTDWGLAYSALTPRLTKKMDEYRFGCAEVRLDDLFRATVNPDLVSAASGISEESLQRLKEPLKRGQSAINYVMKSKEKGEMAKVIDAVKSTVRGNLLPILYFVAVTIGVLVWSQHGQSATLNSQSFIVIWVTIIVLTLLVKQFPSDNVMIGATLTLSFLGVIKSEDAWAAFSNEVVLSVAALSVVGDAVSRTGFVDILFAKIIGQPKSLAVAMLRIYIPCAIGAATISNTAVMACCMPALEDWSARSGTHIGLFFMPISYIMLIAGTFAVFSTSTNLVAQGLLVAHDLPPLSTFELAVPALVLSLVALVYLVVVTPIVLGRFNKEKQEDPSKSMRVSALQRNFQVHMQVQHRNEKTIEASGLLSLLGGSIESIHSVERFGEPLQEEVSAQTVLKMGDIIRMGVPPDFISELAQSSKFLLLGYGKAQLLATTHKELREIVEVVLDEACPLVGQEIDEAHTRKLYDGAVVALRQCRQKERTARVYKPGDQLILEASIGFAERCPFSHHFLAVRKIGTRTKKNIDTVKAYTSGAILAVMLVFVAFSIFPLFCCALGAIFGLALTGCASVEEMKKGVSLKVVLTIVGAFGLGNAIGSHGVAAALGQVLVSLFSPFGHIGLLSAISVAVVLLGIIFHGTAVVALMFPLCMHVAEESGIPLHQMVAVLCYSVACQMLSPVSYNTNLMAFAACPEYTFTDFTKLGAPLVVLILVVGIPLSMFWFGE